MPRPRNKVLYAAGGILLLIVTIAGIWGWTMLRVEEVPEELATMERRPEELVLSAVGGGEDLPLAELRGNTSFIVFEGIQSMRSEQGKEVNRALNRWILPETTRGVIVWDGQGMQLLEDRIAKFVGFFANELRYPIYVDWDGELIDVFKLVKGHHGLIVLDPEGKVLMRHSGGLAGDELEPLRVMLGAEDPPPPPPAPPFEIAGLTNDSCTGTSCVFIVLGRSVARGDIPWIEDGFEGTRTECFERMRRPEIRLAVSTMRVPITESHGVLLGEVTGLELKGWTLSSDDASAREAFDLGPEDSALVVIDAEGRMAFRKTGFIPMYEWTLAIDATGERILREDEL